MVFDILNILMPKLKNVLVKCKLFPRSHQPITNMNSPTPAPTTPDFPEEDQPFVIVAFTNFPGCIFYADCDGGAIIANSWYPFETLVRCDGDHLPIFPDNVFDNG